MALGDILGGFAKGFGQGISDVATLSLEEEIRKKGEQRKTEMAEMAQRKKKSESLANLREMFGAEKGATDVEDMRNTVNRAREMGYNVGFGADGMPTANRMTPQEQAFYQLQKTGKLSQVNLQAAAGVLPTEGQALGLALGQDIGQGGGGVAFADEQQTQPFVSEPSGPGVAQRARDFFGGGPTIKGKTTDRTPDVWLPQIISILKPGEGIPEIWEDFQAEFPGISFEQFTQLLKKQRLPDGNPLVHFGEQPKPVPPPFKKQVETLFGVNPKHLKYP